MYTKVDGIIVIGKAAEFVSDIQIPIVSTDTFCENGILKALKEAIEYFIERNVADIGFISEKRTESKLDSFKDIMEEKAGGVNEKFIRVTDKRFEEGGYFAMNELLESGNVPRAIICAYDYMAIGAMRCIFDKGMKVPEDIAVLGMDDISQARYLNPPLSSISFCVDEVCKAAVDTIIGILTEKESRINVLFEAKLKLRRSTQID